MRHRFDALFAHFAVSGDAPKALLERLNANHAREIVGPTPLDATLTAFRKLRQDQRLSAIEGFMERRGGTSCAGMCSPGPFRQCTVAVR